MRIFVVVGKHRPDLYQYFVAGLAGVQQVEVIVDRRIGRENAQHPVDADIDNRRVARNVYDELHERGFVIVRLPS